MQGVFKSLGAFLLLLVNLALGLWMMFETRRVYLLLFTWFIDARQAQGSELVRATYSLQTLDALLLVVLGLTAVGLLVFVETLYRKAVSQGRLLKVAAFVLGCQLVYLGALQLGGDLALADALVVDLNTGLAVFEVAAGVNLVWLSRRRERLDSRPEA